MNTSPLRIPSAASSHVEELYPKLTAAQIARIASHGRARHVQQGEVLIEAGKRTERFFVVTSCQIEVVHPTDQLIAVLGAGMFTGEVNLLSGRRGLVQIRASEQGEVIKVDRAWVWRRSAPRIE